jgi:hypothetical protein
MRLPPAQPGGSSSHARLSLRNILQRISQEVHERRDATA